MLPDTWTWDGSNWTLQQTLNAPPERAGASLSFDPVRGVTVLFGGATPASNTITGEGIADYADTWTWDGSNWNQLSPAASPSGRQGAGMVFDAARRVTVLFGGYADQETLYKNAFRQDTWTWDGNSWTQQTTASGPPRTESLGFVYDDALGKAVLVGGSMFIIPTYLQSVGAGFIIHAKDTWTLDASGWTDLPPAEPDERSNAVIAYDPATQTVILMGGYCLDQPQSLCFDTWSWDGSHWVQLNTTSPGAYSNGLAYDAATRELVMPSGTDTFTFDGALWTDHPGSADPAMAALLFPGVTQDSSGAPILFGGVTYANGNPTYHNDTFRWDGSRWNKLSVTNAPPMTRHVVRPSSMAASAAEQRHRRATAPPHTSETPGLGTGKPGPSSTRRPRRDSAASASSPTIRERRVPSSSEVCRWTRRGRCSTPSMTRGRGTEAIGHNSRQRRLRVCSSAR
jgi:hypothetical protein